MLNSQCCAVEVKARKLIKIRWVGCGAWKLVENWVFRKFRMYGGSIYIATESISFGFFLPWL